MMCLHKRMWDALNIVIDTCYDVLQIGPNIEIHFINFLVRAVTFVKIGLKFLLVISWKKSPIIHAKLIKVTT